MPMYEFLCQECGIVEKILPVGHLLTRCWTCGSPLTSLISAPGSLKFPDMEKVRKKRQRITEPVWRYPNGKIESMNSKNTRSEE